MKGAKFTLENGDEYSVYQLKGKFDRIHSTDYVSELRTRAVFRLTGESWLDGVCKRIGFATELQTGDAEFDASIYIACDSPMFHSAVTESSAIRDCVSNLVKSGAISVTATGESLAIRLKGDRSGDLEIATQLVALTHLLRAEEARVLTNRQDPFLSKVIVIEALIWGLSAYALFSFSADIASKRELYFYLMPVFYRSLWFGGGLALGLLFLIRRYLKGSSRSHRVLVESALALGLALPFSAYNLVSDINISMDTNPDIVLERVILSAERRKHRRSTSYHLNLEKLQVEQGVEISRWIRVNQEDYDLASKDGPTKMARITVGPGYLGFPYMRDLEIVTLDSKTSDF